MKPPFHGTFMTKFQCDSLVRPRLMWPRGRRPEYPASMKAEETFGLFDQNQDLPRKSEILAGFMSAVVPGSGYIYTEHYGDGITAFLINALAIAGTVTAVCNKNYAEAAIVGSIGRHVEVISKKDY